MTTLISEQAADLKVEHVDTHDIETPMGVVRFLRAKVPMVSARESYALTCQANKIAVDDSQRMSLSAETRWACVTYAFLFKPGTDETLVETYVGTHLPEAAARRPPPTDDPEVMRKLFKQLGEALANKLCEAQKLAPVHSDSPLRAPEDQELFATEEDRTERTKRSLALMGEIEEEIDAISCKVVDWQTQNGTLPLHRIDVMAAGGRVSLDISDLDGRP